jgi:hypothetical protein
LNAYDIDRLFSELAAFDLDALAKRVKRLNERDRAGTTIPDGYGSRTLNTDIPASDPEALTPTERAADRRAFGRPERDLVHEANIHCLSALRQALTAIEGVLDSVKRGEELQRWEKPVGQTSTPCKADGCDGPAVARGWCDPCRKWIGRNPTADGLDPVTVPSSVIEERTKRRAKAS